MKTILAATAAAFLLLAGSAYAGEESVTDGAVTATLSWNGDPSDLDHGALAITRDGATAFSAPIPKIACDGCRLAGGGAEDVQVRDLDADGEDEVIVVADTGGAECCTEAGVWDFVPATGTYRETDLGFVTAGFNLDDLDHDGIPEIVTQDARFEAYFTDLADQVLPPVIIDYGHVYGAPGVSNVTGLFPASLRASAAAAKRRFAHLRRADPNARGWLATYVADESLLGRGATGLGELTRQSGRGILGSPRAARAYRSRLLRRLHAWGYR
jgi:hypothetical protein